MNPWNTIVSGAGLLIAVIALFLALDARAERPAEWAEAPAAPDLAPAVEGLRYELLTLRDETARLRAELVTRQVSTEDPASARDATPPDPAGNDQEAESRCAEFLALGRRILGGEATPDETARFYDLARSGDLIDGLISRLDEDVAEAPSDVDARLQLAEACILKLFTVPAGPEMAIWGGRAEAQWREILQQEPDHWEARFRLAVSLSYHPDAQSATSEAIRHLDRLVRQQESMSAEPRQGDTYRLLAMMHLRRGDRERAEQTLRRGRERHPTDVKIEKALEEYDR